MYYIKRWLRHVPLLTSEVSISSCWRESPQISSKYEAWQFKIVQVHRSDISCVTIKICGLIQRKHCWYVFRENLWSHNLVATMQLLQNWAWVWFLKLMIACACWQEPFLGKAYLSKLRRNMVDIFFQLGFSLGHPIAQVLEKYEYSCYFLFLVKDSCKFRTDCRITV